MGKITKEKFKKNVQKYLIPLLRKAWGIAFQKIIENIIDIFFN